MMKALFAIGLLLLVDVIMASPIPESDNHRWGLVPDSEGKMHLVDMNPYEVELEPRFVASRDIRLLLRTRRNPTAAQTLTQSVASIQASQFNPAHPTRFTIHGWNGGANSGVNTNSAAGYLQRGEFNVIAVDWAAGANSNYITSRNRVDEVGEFLGQFIDFLHQNGFVNFATLHVAGHSLGGHAAGITGKNTNRGRIAAIYALDPAGPLFTVGNPERRVAVGDGAYVEVIHTNGNILGFGNPIGDADFYPNGGNSQTGCGTDAAGSCAHSRVVPLFVESINSVRFNAVGCTTFASINANGCTQNALRAAMGREAGVRGMFWLRTNGATPFAIG